MATVAIAKPDFSKMKASATFDYAKFSDKETVIASIELEKTDKKSQFANGSQHFFTVKTKPLGKMPVQRDGHMQEVDICATERYSCTEKEGVPTGWPENGEMQALLNLTGRNHPQELIGMKVRTYKKMKRNGKTYLGWNPI